MILYFTHTQSIVCATADNHCLEYLGYITLVQTANAGAPRLPERPKINGPDIKRPSIIFLSPYILQNCISIWCNPLNINHVGSFKNFLVTLLHFQQQVFWWYFNRMMKRLTPVDLYLISEKSIWKNQVRWTGFLV